MAKYEELTEKGITRILNNRGEYVGFVNIDEGRYYTERDKNKGEVFIKKTSFNNSFNESIYYENPIAIDVDILQYLIKTGVKEIIFKLIGIEEKPVQYIILVQDFLMNSCLINYDKMGSDGIGTNYNTQRVCGTNFMKKIDYNQKELK